MSTQGETLTDTEAVFRAIDDERIVPWIDDRGRLRLRGPRRAANTAAWILGNEACRRVVLAAAALDDCAEANRFDA